MNLDRKITQFKENLITLQQDTFKMRSEIPLTCKNTHDWLRMVEDCLANAVERMKHAADRLEIECPALLAIPAPVDAIYEDIGIKDAAF